MALLEATSAAAEAAARIDAVRRDAEASKQVSCTVVTARVAPVKACAAAWSPRCARRGNCLRTKLLPIKSTDRRLLAVT